MYRLDFKLGLLVKKAVNEKERNELPYCSYVSTPRRKRLLLEKQVDNQMAYQENSAEVLKEIIYNLKNIFKNMKKVKKFKK